MAHYMARSTEIECAGCANSIRNSLSKLPGVQKVDVDIARKLIDVEYEPAQVNATTIEDRLARAGFPPEQS